MSRRHATRRHALPAISLHGQDHCSAPAKSTASLPGMALRSCQVAPDTRLLVPAEVGPCVKRVIMSSAFFAWSMGTCIYSWQVGGGERQGRAALAHGLVFVWGGQQYT